MKNLAQQYDCLLVDLDGTVFRGRRPTEGAVQALDEAAGRKLFVTNNASRSADEVAAHLRELGFTATADDVVTSAQSAAHLLAGQLPPDSPVLIVGTDALANEIAAVGLRPVRRYDDNPVAVVQGLSTTIGWPDLAEAALAIRAGALWVAANVDPTLPTERGLLPGNGSLVAALRTATGAEPQVAGKPGPQLMTDAVARGDFRAPLVIGDRLDTDIEGANAAELPSLMVLTGVNTARDAVLRQPARAAHLHRPRPALAAPGRQAARGGAAAGLAGRPQRWRGHRQHQRRRRRRWGRGRVIDRSRRRRRGMGRRIDKSATAHRGRRRRGARRPEFLRVVLNNTLHNRIGGVRVESRLRYFLSFCSRGKTRLEVLLNLSDKLQTMWVGFPQREFPDGCSHAAVVAADVSMRRRRPYQHNRGDGHDGDGHADRRGGKGDTHAAYIPSWTPFRPPRVGSVWKGDYRKDAMTTDPDADPR